MVVFRLIHDITGRFKVVRGALAYAILWPFGCLLQQTILEKRTFKDYDWHKCLRYSMYGALFNGPTLYYWIRIASQMWPKSDIRSSLAKAFTEQIAYDPFAITIFLYTMTLAEGHSKKEARAEVAEKFLPSYQIGFIYWPIVQTMNFAFVPKKNQVIVAGIGSVFWTTFLACVKAMKRDDLKEQPEQVELK
ncbi:mpv17-like protein [Culicoides brevitarsis]|uniref:mpv17-like protein n=1 Tax=Culicoides brevitarsis TaxID=469753 RepID=UPI00307B993B